MVGPRDIPPAPHFLALCIPAELFTVRVEADQHTWLRRFRRLSAFSFCAALFFEQFAPAGITEHVVALSQLTMRNHFSVWQQCRHARRTGGEPIGDARIVGREGAEALIPLVLQGCPVDPSRRAEGIWVLEMVLRIAMRRFCKRLAGFKPHT